MSERLTRLLRVCRGEEKWVLPSGNGEGKQEVVSACLHAFRVKIAREQRTEKNIGRGIGVSGRSVVGDTSWRGDRGVVSGEGGKKK